MAGAKARRLTRDSVARPSERGHVSECTCYRAAFVGMPEEGTATSSLARRRQDRRDSSALGASTVWGLNSEDRVEVEGREAGTRRSAGHAFPHAYPSRRWGRVFPQGASA